MVLEVSQKQRYIFSSKKLRDNVDRSAAICCVTSGPFFEQVAGDLYDPEQNMVYSGGGHTVLQFDRADQAVGFARKVTRFVLERLPGIQLFVKQMPYDSSMASGENLHQLIRRLDEKKSLRKAALGQKSFGVEVLDEQSFRPKMAEQGNLKQLLGDLSCPSLDDKFPTLVQDLAGEDPFVAVVHIDGNAMGKRVDEIYSRFRCEDWETFCSKVRQFSEGIQHDFQTAFDDMVNQVCSQDVLMSGRYFLPIRPLILAGDDVCFLTAGSIGLECARLFLERLASLNNPVDGLPYAACAGVALVHQKFPFHQAYDLSERLCQNAKDFAASLDPKGRRVSAMDWHIEFGQLKDSLTQLREDYNTQDNARLELRPVTVVAPDGCPDAGVRSYSFFRGMCRAMQKEDDKTARSKRLGLRDALKQGEVESRFFLRSNSIGDVLYHSFEAEFPTEQQRMEQYRKWFGGSYHFEKEIFRQLDGDQKRCLLFDALEMADHCIFFQEVTS